MSETPPMDSLSEKLEHLKAKGFTEEFDIIGETLVSADEKHFFKPDQITIIEHHRFEGNSDPADMAVVYAVETGSGLKGIIIDGFGISSDPEKEAFIKKITEIHDGNIY